MDQREKIRELLQKFDTAALITHGDETHFHVRPMALADVEENGDVWFITGSGSPKTQEIEEDARVQVVCQDGWSSCVTIAGRASLVRDPVRVRELWKTNYKVWFPEGPDDPSIVLIRVIPELGEYWDNRGQNAVRYAFESVKALVTGTRPHVQEKEQHSKTALHGFTGTLAGKAK